MGYGGALFWTGLAYNLKRNFPKKKIIFIISDYSENGKYKTHPDKVIYKNNSDISFIIPKRKSGLLARLLKNNSKYFLIDQTDSNYHYWKENNIEIIKYKTGKHAIELKCENFNISDVLLKPKLNLVSSEITNAEKVLSKNNLTHKKYICIEPTSKTSFTPNKQWFEDRWLELVLLLKQYIIENKLNIELVQIGNNNEFKLPIENNLTGLLTFRETGYIIKKSLFMITYMGGLVHLSKAFDKKNIVLISAWEPKELASYKDDINFYTDIECKHCGLLTPCPRNRECMQKIEVQKVLKACIDLINNVTNDKNIH